MSQIPPSFLDLTNIPRVANRRRPTHAPPHTPHNDNHQPQPAQHTRQSIQVRAPPPQPIDLSHPRADSRQASTETVLNALQNLTTHETTSYWTTNADPNVLEIIAHRLNRRAEHIRGESAQRKWRDEAVELDRDVES